VAILIGERPAQALWRDYLELTKPKVVVLMLITSLVGMFLATRAGVPWTVLVFGNLGIALCAGGAAAVNHVVDRRIDALMARTHKRPLAEGRVSPAAALTFALVLALLGQALLLTFTNPLTAWLTLASLLGYAVVYTGFLKRATPQNIVIGGLAGAAPPAHSAMPRLPNTSTVHGTPARVARNMPTSEVISISTTTFGLVSSR
jgi:protoheme IX farnesyltransferase